MLKKGHLYYFLRSVWPKMGHRELLLAPEWWVKILNRNSKDNLIFTRYNRPSPEEGTVLKKKKKNKVYKMGAKKAAA